ncbi:uncharacterized protein si:busm1-163l24.3 isoform X2 [Melanotaenia boesemani]|uniref:uncharacterized protein si:busm1-163l24.3 isoform X2 n=1 Tax=Melanotaenia boesemani TaxID=1250792 RepID=UPI001C045878|nr:uncharacterized protein si:busm1-163l24.3 isoform X2 [Melanotaenia boesemani]
MAESGRTVRVSGLPTDMEESRLRDKLFIHFLSTKNGGGEIDSVVFIKATPVFALISFDDSTVAQRVIQRGQHLLAVDRKKYTLTVTEHRESLDPDKIILNLSAAVDYSRLPGGIMAFSSLRKSHRDVQIRYTDTEGCCMLSGSYSKVQAALAQLLGQPGGAESADNKDSDRATPGGSWSAQKPHKQKSDDQSRKTNKQRENNPNGRPSDDYSLSSSRDLTPGIYGWEENRDGAALHHPATSVEDLSLILDADMFQYLQKCCRREYQRILSQYGVEVIDETNQGLTTLFLQVAETAGMEDGREQERLKLARNAISQLYQQNESKIRRDQLPKTILSPRGGLQRALENLCVRFPKLLLNEDELNIYIIGSSSDVSEAKHSLLLDHDEVRDKKDDVASLVRYPSYDFGSSSSHADKEGVLHRTPSSVGSLDERIDHIMRSEEDESRAEGARRYKLAARFKDSGLTALGSRPTDFTLRGNSASSRQTRLGPMLGHDVLSEKAGISGEVSRAVAQNTGGDILFKVGSTLPPSASMQTKTSSSPSTIHSSLSGSTALPPAGSGSTLKRANSFSGTPQQKAQIVGQKSQDDSSKPTVKGKGRSSSFSSPTGRDSKQEVYNAEIVVSPVMWKYIKEAYRTRVEDLTSDVQMNESLSEAGREQTLILNGADSSIVSSCQHGLQKLIDSVKVDFSVQELRLSELGITDTDETLQACCSEVKSRFKKVTFHRLKNRLCLLGPKELCSQVVATLQEVFSGEFEQHPFSRPSTSFSQINVHQSSSLPASSHLKVLQGSQTSKADGTSGNQEWKTTYRNDFCEMQAVNGSISHSSMRQDHVIKEKVKTVDTMKVDVQTSESFVNQSVSSNDSSSSPVNGGETERPISTTQTDSTEQKQSSPEESRSGQGDRMHMCVCGKNGTSLIRTKCGVSMCPKCLETIHANCRVCRETEQTRWGIQGEMKRSRLSISLPGHNKDCVIKITYCIPDGIQGEGHPSPGKPFQGGIFEAYLPDCEKAKKLLPRLEKAFRQGLTFTVTGKETEARVTWDCIPHKTSLQGGKSQKGYPDSMYLTRLSEVLSANGIEARSHK